MTTFLAHLTTPKPPPTTTAPHFDIPAIQLAACAFVLIILLTYILKKLTTSFFGPSCTTQREIFVNDYAVFKEFDRSWQLLPHDWRKKQLETYKVSQEAVDFCQTIIQRSGIGSEEHSLQNLSPGLSAEIPDLSLASARYEAEITMFTCVERVLAKNNVLPQDVDILVVNCSLFCPTPSLAAMIINKFKMREDIVVYNLSGMGCSAAPIAIQLASQMLRLSQKSHPLALVVSTEVLTMNSYTGNVKEFIMSNSLFRMNGSAALLSTDATSVYKRPAPKWKIEDITRLHIGADDKAYKAIHLMEDEARNTGVRISQDLVPAVGGAVKIALTKLAPKVLPIAELLRFGVRMVLYTIFPSVFKGLLGRKVIVKKYNKEKASFFQQQKQENQQQQQDNQDQNKQQNTLYSQDKAQQFIDNIEKQDPTLKHIKDTTLLKQTMINYEQYDENCEYFTKITPPLPNFKTAFDSFCIHPGGKAVVTSVASGMSLTQDDIQHSLNVLKKFGNVSSSSLWYVLDDIEEKKGAAIHNGHRVLGLCLGSGVKVNTIQFTATNRDLGWLW